MEYERGPFEPIDPRVIPPARERHDFEELFAVLMRDLGGADVALEGVERAVGDANTPAEVDGAARDTIDVAEERLIDSRHLIENIRPEELIEQTDGHAEVIEATDREYEAEQEGEAPELPDYDPDRDDKPPNRPPLPA